MKKPPVAKRGTHVTVLIIGLLFASGGLRLGGVDMAFANAGVTAPAAPETAQCIPEADLGDMLSAMQARQVDLDAREARVAEREQTLALVEAEVQRNLIVLKEAEARLAATLSIADQAAEGDLVRLTAMYENMKPKLAAGLFETMAPEFAAGFLGRMRPDAAAAVLSGLKPKTAYMISVVLAGRNAEAPRN